MRFLMRFLMRFRLQNIEIAWKIARKHNATSNRDVRRHHWPRWAGQKDGKAATSPLTGSRAQAIPRNVISQLDISKTSGKLGPNHYRNGARDRFEGQDSINQSINQAKMPRKYNCCVPGCTNSHNCNGAALLLGISVCPVPPNDPKCLFVADSDPGSYSFW